MLSAMSRCLPGPNDRLAFLTVPPRPVSPGRDRPPVAPGVARSRAGRSGAFPPGRPPPVAAAARRVPVGSDPTARAGRRGRRGHGVARSFVASFVRSDLRITVLRLY